MSFAASAVMAFILGTILGSFLNVVIYRLPRGLSIVRPGSRCPHCHTLIRPRDNIPLVSFLILRGRCRTCRAPISWRYPLVEAASGGLLAGLWIRFAPAGAWVPLAATALFALMLVVVLFAIPQGRLVPSALVAAGAGALFLMIAVVSGGGMGGGDIKLAAMMGAFLGWPLTAVALLLAFVTGAVAGVLLIALKRRSRKDPIPFGPSLAAGGVIAMFAGQSLLRWYFGIP